MLIRCCVLFGAMIVLAGCKDNKPTGDLPELHPLTGKVLRGGTPVAGGLLQFRPDPDSSTIVVNAEVNPDGTFEAQTTHAVSQKKAKGAPAGKYRMMYLPPSTEQKSTNAPTQLPQVVTVNAGPNDVTVEVGKK